MFPNGFDKFGRYIWIKKTDHWEFYEGRFNIKRTFLIELANIVKSTKNISNQSEKTDALTILENVLAGRKTEIENLYKDIGGLSKLSLAQDTSFLYDDSNLINKTSITELNKYISIYGSISYYGNTKSLNEEDLITPRNKIKFQAQKMFIKTKLNCNWQK